MHQLDYREKPQKFTLLQPGMRDKGARGAGADGKWKYSMVIFVLQLAWGGFLIIVLFQYSKLKLLYGKVQFRA